MDDKDDRASRSLCHVDARVSRGIRSPAKLVLGARWKIDGGKGREGSIETFADVVVGEGLSRVRLVLPRMRTVRTHGLRG